MSDKKISVIIPLYNTEKYIKRCLDSILKQTYSALEIIVVDDNSTDKGPDFAAELAKSDSRIKILHHEKNMGLFHARITGVENATGDYIAFVDSDDYISADFFRVLVEKAEANSCDIVIGKVTHEDERGYRYVHNLYDSIEFGTMEDDEILSAFWEQCGCNFIWHTVWNKLYSKKLWDKALPILKRQDKHLIMTEDLVFSSVLMNYAERLSATEYGCYYYFQHSGASTSVGADKKKFEKNINDLKTAFDFVESVICSKEYRLDVKDNFIKWKRLYKFFWRRNIENSGLSDNDKNMLYRLLDNNFGENEENAEYPDYPDYFYTVSTEYDNRYNDIIDRINSDAIKCVSFDIFDTSILRPFYRPTDVFVMLDKTFAKEYPKEKRSFSQLRINAEKALRDEKIYGAFACKEEITLKEIYEKIAALSFIDENTLSRFMQYEQLYELKFCRARKSVFNIYKAALRLGKEVFFTSDIYLDEKFIIKLLKNNGYDKYDGLILSCIEEKTKRTGELYKVLIDKAKCDKEQILHIGDNWESDVASAKAAGINAQFYPAPLDCIQYNVPDICSTHSCCPYSEPSGSMINFEKSLQFLGVRTALAVAANKLYDNPFISYNKRSEMNCSPRYLGYYALGMHILGFVKWFTESAADMGYDTLAFIARDGWLPMKAYEIIKEYYPSAPKEKYIYTSRKASLVWGVKKAADLFNLYDCINPQKCTPDNFAELISPVIENYDSLVLKANDIDVNKPIGGYESFCRLVKIIGANFFSEDKCKKYSRCMAEYFADILSGKTACVDIGYSGRTQELLKTLTGKTIDAFYVHTNDGAAFDTERKHKFSIYSFYDYTPSITGGIREVLISKCAPSCTGYSIEENSVKPVFEAQRYSYPERFLMSGIQNGCLDFIRDFCSLFGEYLDIMEMRGTDVSYPYEYFLGTLTDIDAHMFDCLKFEDDMWLGNTVPMPEYWKNCIRYHKIVPFYLQDRQYGYDEYRLQEELFYKKGIDKKGKLRKALFWYAVDRTVFNEKLKKAFGKNKE